MLKMGVLVRFMAACGMVLLALLLNVPFGRAACDNKCREITAYYEDQGPAGIKSFAMDELDCSECIHPLSLCRDSTAPGKGTCQGSGMMMNWGLSAGACQLRCTLQIGGKAEATGCVQGKNNQIPQSKCK